MQENRNFCICNSHEDVIEDIMVYDRNLCDGKDECEKFIDKFGEESNEYVEIVNKIHD